MSEINISANNKRIAKNTVALYFRQILTMLVTLYTSRVVLQVLGENDFGIYNVVGGMVLMFSFITGTMASASQRFLAYDMVSSDQIKLRQTFSLIMLSYFGLAILAVVLCESIGVWFLNNMMTIPSERLNSANWVLQFSILTFVFNILTAPYISVIIAREKMGIYAWVGIAEVVLKLSVVFALEYFLYDKLITYSILMCGCVFLVTAFYRLYCKNNFKESHYIFYWDFVRFKTLCSYAVWNVLGSLATVLRSHGINVLLNIFFNPVINAARAIAYQVNTAIYSFINNFYTAVRPQITKNYASGNKQRVFSIVFRSSKFSFFLLLLIELPLFFNVDYVLELWLGNVPDYCSLFMKYVLLNSLLEVFSIPLLSLLQADGDIKKMQIYVSVLFLLVIPISYIFLRCGYPPEVTVQINMILVAITLIPRLLLCRRQCGLVIGDYMKSVLFRCFITLIPSVLVGLYIHSIVHFETMFVNCIVSSFSMILCTIIFIWLIGIDKQERNMIVGQVKKVLFK